MSETNIKEMNQKIQNLKKTALELKATADDFPAVYRNCSRILASVKMLEMNISDLIEEV